MQRLISLFILCFLEVFLLIKNPASTDIEKITPWLLGINFSIAIFSINFTFFGYQLSKYKAMYTEVTKRQWFNITALLILPFVPLACLLIAPEFFGRAALWILPFLAFSAIDNAVLTSEHLNPNKFIKDNVSDKAISLYLNALLKEIRVEFGEHRAYLKNKDKFQIPAHAARFESGIFGIGSADLWSSISVITKLSIENNDYSVFQSSIKAVLKLMSASYYFKEADESDYQISEALRDVAHKRLLSIANIIFNTDEDGMFLLALSAELCSFLTKEEVVAHPCSNVTMDISSDAVVVGNKILERKNLAAPIKLLNTNHRIIELGIYRLETDEGKNSANPTDRYNISVYAHRIKALGITALRSDNSHFAYRCMETLSYLGCNAAKLKSTQTIVAVFESIVQMARVAKQLNIGCFWSRCLIPAESHAEEFLGHILTWLAQDLSADGRFYMKDYAEQAYSRVRGVKCVVRPKPNLNPCFWIEELKENDEKIKHVEYESGMYGYGGELDYSDVSNLKEYVLHGIGSESQAYIVHSSPIPITSTDDNSDK